jgi:acetylornithine/succinyldiaminopimelate/putrescine aminotransferase
MGLEISHGQGSFLFDKNGKSYLDLISGISVSNLGHGNLKVLEAIKNQADRYMHTLVYGEHIQDVQVELATALAQTLPSCLSQIFFVNSGSEAVEGAMKLVKRATGRFEILACEKAYHGSSHGALSLNGDEYFKRNYRPLLPGIQQIEFGNFDDLHSISTKTAAVFIETVQGEAGVRKASPDYFKALRKKCDSVGALLVCDEIQAGFGRTGTFWAFEQMEIEPDIVLMAKGMGGGMPLGAFAASQDLMKCFTENPVLGHISTFGGHPVCCAASLACLQFIQKNNLCSQVVGKENLFLNLLNHPRIIEIRSVGLMMAMELGTFEKVYSLIQFCLGKGLITDWFLHCNTALRLAPPLTITHEEIHLACSILMEGLDQLEN